jgi:hypothetical protein
MELFLQIIIIIIIFHHLDTAMKEDAAVSKEKKPPSIIKMEVSMKEKLLMDSETDSVNLFSKMEPIMKEIGAKTVCMAMGSFSIIRVKWLMKGKLYKKK